MGGWRLRRFWGACEGGPGCLGGGGGGGYGWEGPGRNRVKTVVTGLARGLGFVLSGRVGGLAGVGFVLSGRSAAGVGFVLSGRSGRAGLGSFCRAGGPGLGSFCRAGLGAAGLGSFCRAGWRASRGVGFVLSGRVGGLRGLGSFCRAGRRPGGLGSFCRAGWRAWRGVGFVLSGRLAAGGDWVRSVGPVGGPGGWVRSGNFYFFSRDFAIGRRPIPGHIVSWSGSACNGFGAATSARGSRFGLQFQRVRGRAGLGKKAAGCCDRRGGFMRDELQSRHAFFDLVVVGGQRRDR